MLSKILGRMNIAEDEQGFKEIKAKVLNTVVQQKNSKSRRSSSNEPFQYNTSYVTKNRLTAIKT
jgi:hypothetical protein